MQFFLYFAMKDGEPGPQPPSPEAMAEMGTFTQEAIDIAAKHCEWLGMDVRLTQVAGPSSD